jgi:hypothetical protein
MLPDDALLELFDLCVVGARSIQGQSLAHVCRRWRIVVFGSPNRLNLRLICTQKTPARDTLNVWPPFPLLIISRKTSNLQECFDNIISVLERSDRVRSNQPHGSFKFAIGNTFGSDAGAIPRADISGPLVIWRGGASSRFVLGWVCRASAIPSVISHSISGFTETTFVCHSPCYTSTFGNSSFRVHSTRGDVHCPLHVD